jgi:hypothetical protein
LLCSAGWPWTRDSPASSSYVLGLQTSTTTPVSICTSLWNFVLTKVSGLCHFFKLGLYYCLLKASFRWLEMLTWKADWR